MTLTLGLAAAALLLALVAVAVALLAYRRSDDANERLRAIQRLAAGTQRSHREGTPRERVDRRRDTFGPPPGLVERRVEQRPADEWPDTGDLPATQEHAAPTTMLPLPGRIRQSRR